MEVTIVSLKVEVRTSLLVGAREKVVVAPRRDVTSHARISFGPLPEGPSCSPICDTFPFLHLGRVESSSEASGSEMPRARYGFERACAESI